MTDPPIVRVFPSGPDLARAAADEIVRIVTATLAERTSCFVALTGGGTARHTYEAIAAQHRTGVQWDRVHFFWGDDRHVPPDHPDSNFRMANDSLLRPLGIVEEQIHRIPAEHPTAADAADEYEVTLRAFFAPPPGERPVFDLLLLGMGDDAHVASLFPGSDALHSVDRLVLAPWVPHLGTYRITLSLPVLNAAAAVRFVVSGSRKADALGRVLEGPFDPVRCPAQAIRPSSGNLAWLVDRHAAELLARPD